VGNFEFISWLNGLFFGGGHRGFLKEEVKTYPITPMWRLDSPTFFDRHIYSLWSRQGLFGRHWKWSMQGPPHMDLMWRGPRRDLGSHGRCGEVHAKTLQGPFFILK
jgi:hypothetical protein